MTRKRAWEIGTTVALVGVLAACGGGFYAWREYRRWLGAQMVAALDRCDAPAVERFLNRGADPNTHGRRSGITPLILGALSCRESLVNEALRLGADVNDRGRYMEAALAVATHCDSHSIVATLLSQRARVNARDYGGGTTLMDAAAEGNEAVVRMLLAAGADAKAVANDGGSVLWQARHGYEVESQLALEEREDARKIGRDLPPGPHQCRAAAYRRIIELLRSRGAKDPTY
jgi:hypothetical protein